jgi:nuclear pore complex protein Nup98-Nup96
MKREELLTNLSNLQLHKDELESMLKKITVKHINEVPLVSHMSIPFSDIGKFDKALPTDDDLDIQHMIAYKLAHVLFDDYADQYSYGLSDAQCKQFDHRIRRDRLTEFLSALLAYETLAYDGIPQDAPDRLEHLAVINLCKHDINTAAECLKENKDNHLALLVSQLDQADEFFQDDMSTQIRDWNEQNIISEMTDPIRALYSILSGNSSSVKGKSSGPLEDRSSTFAISERFNLTWLQAFGLTLWYGRCKNDSIEESIIEFAEKIESGDEVARPMTGNGKEDIIWVLLKLYASRKGRMARPVLPQAISESSLAERPTDSYYAFTLHHALLAKLGKSGEVAVDHEAADQLAADLAFEASSTMEEGKGNYAIVIAIFALLHIQDTETRKASVKDLLNRFAAYLADDTKTLTDSLKIPAAWIWEAKALYAKSNHDADTELSCLIEAKLYEAAHECLCRRVAPTMVIDEDWQGLTAALSQFPERAAVKEWASGGAVYDLFARAMGDSTEKGDLDALQASLLEMGRTSKSAATVKEGRSTIGVEELRVHVAVREMSRVVAGLLGGDSGSHNKKATAAAAASILPLPMTSDARLRETKMLAVEYYRGVMAR